MAERTFLGAYVFEVWSENGELCVKHTLAEVGLMPRALPLLSREEMAAAARHVNAAAESVGKCVYHAIRPDTADLVPIRFSSSEN